MQQEQVHRKPAWLELFLEIIFFNNCSIHHEMSKNRMNQYCMDCNLPKCIYCVSSSCSCHGHETIKLYRYSYQDAILAGDIVKFIDCSKIQLYKCNDQPVVLKNPLIKNAQGVQASSACSICTRILRDPDLYSYCSLECKVKAFSRKLRATDPPFLENGAAAAAVAAVAEKAAQRKKRRKGVPHRAI